MRSKLIIALAVLGFSLPAMAQVRAPFEGGRSDFTIGGGIDYWKGDWSKIARFGPSAWSTKEIWHGIGVIAEGHSMIAGGDAGASKYKYFAGEGGVIYNYERFRRFVPYAKGELGFASLSFPHKVTSHYTHDTRNTWALGGGVEFALTRRIWTRIDYTYEGFPDFYSQVTGQHNTLDPNGVSVGATYHFR